MNGNTPAIITIAVVSLSIAVLAVVFLPFIAAACHVTYTLDNASLTVVIGALGGIIGALLALKNNNDQKK